MGQVPAFSLEFSMSTEPDAKTVAETKSSFAEDEKVKSSGVGSDADHESPRPQLSRAASKRSEIDPTAEPPDGGLNAWLKVLGCFLLYSNVWGFTLTFGVFQSYYQHSFLSSSSPSAISWIGTVQSWMLIVVGVLSGPLFDLGWFRVMLVVGNVLVIFGLFMVSLCDKYWQVFLAQGICMGLGAGLLYVPSLALIGLSFSKKRALAQGITTSGIAVGGVVYIISFDRVTPSAGFGWGVRTMAFVALGISAIAFPCLLAGSSALAKARTRRKLYDAAAFKDPGFLIFTAAMFTTFFGYVVPYFYIATYAQDALGISEHFALYILVISIAASFFGRIFIGAIAHHLGPILTWSCVAAVSGIISLCWIAVRTRAELIVFAVFWGFCSGGLVTLPAAVFPRLCPDLRRLGTRTGMSWGLSSFGSLTGSPIAGALLRHGGASRHDFLGPQLFTGCCELAGAAIILALWLNTVKRQKTKWLA